MHAVRSLLLLLMAVFITLALLLAGATGVGALLHWLLPGIELGTAVLIGVVALAVSTRFVLNLLGETQSVREALTDEELRELVEAVHHPPRRRRSRR